MKNKILLLILSISVATFAQQWDGSIVAPQITDNTYQITTGAELAWVAQQSQTDNFAGKTILLLNDIDLGEGNNWIPIAGGDASFEGTFDGQCHTIKRLNIFYMQRNSDAGLFGAIGSNGVVKNIAIESGKIFVSEITNVGAIAGRNAGTISHCFAMIQILADASNNVGGLVGSNEGTLTYSYQAGYISDAGNNSGGLAGINNGTISNSYCSGYTMSSGANCGSVVGVNKGTFVNCFFDQQMCLQKASTKDEDGVTAVTTTTEMYTIFQGDNNWVTTLLVDPILNVSYGTYPQLACFNNTSYNASYTSVIPIWLPTVEAPIQRAESITESFFAMGAEDIKWVSPDNDVIKFATGNHSRVLAQVARQCSKRVIVATVSYGGSQRGYLLQVVGFNTFNPGAIGGDKKTCNGDIIKFSDRNKGGEMMDAVGGRDDDKKKYPYYYKIEQYQLIDKNNDSIFEDTVLYQTYFLDSNNYPDFICDTQHDGHWAYRRYAHDSQCQLDYVQSYGEFYLTVFSGFEPGKVESTTDTIYGDYPKSIHIGSEQDASGGEGPYLYEWYYTHMLIDYNSADTTIRVDSARIKDTDKYSATLDTAVLATGEYFFYRAARDLYCHRDFYSSSEGARHFVVFDSLKAGSIIADTIDICATDLLPSINQTEAPTGGNGIYSYRWLINDQPIANTDSIDLLPDDIIISAGNTYRFRRQVKDNTGLMDWTDSEGTFVVHVWKAFNPGQIREAQQLICLDNDVVYIPIVANNQQFPDGDGTINYRWQIFNITDDSHTLLQTIPHNEPNISDSLFFSISLPAQLQIIRQAQNPLCNDAWFDSDGSLTITIDQNKPLSEDIILCREDMPFHGKYTFSNGDSQDYTFTTDGQTITLYGKTLSGCNETITLTGHVADVPAADVEPIGVICQTDTFIHINYRITHGHPDTYHIFYADAAYIAGFEEIYHTLTDNEGTIDIPIGAVPLGEYAMYVEFIEGSQGTFGCHSDIDTLTFSVNLGGFVHQKWNDVLYIDNNNKNGFPDAENDLQFGAYQWYKDDEPINGATGQVYNETGGLNGVYYALLTDLEGNVYKTCPIEVRPTGLSELYNTLSVYPTMVNAGEHINIYIPNRGTLQIISADGMLINSISVDNNASQINAPMTSGVYLLRLITTQGDQLFNQIIVH